MGVPVLDFRRPHVLRTAAEYKAAVAEVDRLLDRNVKKGSAGYDRLELLSVLIQAYEDEHVPELSASTPQDIVAFMLEQKGMTRGELTPHLGGRSRVSDFFAGKRALSTRQIKALRELLGIPADLLLP
jgi:HTH-type transcriptional regulator/antitoxin HigA